MDRERIDTLMKRFHDGQLDRRAFLTRAAALGLSAGAATTLARTAGAQDASPA
nr:twin-arginine translocation signal domain-containing protein [Chloroflexia bacterium]